MVVYKMLASLHWIDHQCKLSWSVIHGIMTPDSMTSVSCTLPCGRTISNWNLHPFRNPFRISPKMPVTCNDNYLLLFCISEKQSVLNMTEKDCYCFPSSLGATVQNNESTESNQQKLFCIWFTLENSFWQWKWIYVYKVCKTLLGCNILKYK